MAGESWVSEQERDFLYSLVKSCDWLLEVGSASGVTAAEIAIARPDVGVVCVDPYFYSIERRADWFKNRRSNMSLFTGTLAQALISLPKRRYGLAFIDGGHLRHECFEDLILANLVTDRIAVHDYGDPNNAGVKCAVDQFCTLFKRQIVNQVGSIVVLEPF